MRDFSVLRIDQSNQRHVGFLLLVLPFLESGVELVIQCSAVEVIFAGGIKEDGDAAGLQEEAIEFGHDLIEARPIGVGIGLRKSAGSHCGGEVRVRRPGRQWHVTGVEGVAKSPDPELVTFAQLAFEIGIEDFFYGIVDGAGTGLHGARSFDDQQVRG